MDTTVLLEKLISIERFIGVEPDSVIRLKVIDVVDCILAMQETRAQSRRRRMIFANGETARTARQKGNVTAIRGCSAKPRLVWSNPSIRKEQSKPPACA